MPEEKFEPNSYAHRKKKEEHKLKKVVTHSATMSKPSLYERTIGLIISADMNDIRQYLLNDIIIPLIKKGITGTVDLLLYKDPNHSRAQRGTWLNSPSYTNYGGYYMASKSQQAPKKEVIKGLYDYEKLRFETRGDAEIVMDGLFEAIEQFDVVSIGDLYDLADYPTNNYTVNNYGWTDLKGSDIIRVDGGYVLKLPKASPINH